MHYIGIDGGGTKTEFVICNEIGKVLNSLTLGTIHYAQIGFNESLNRVKEGIKELCINSGCEYDDIKAIGIGIPGFGEVQSDSNKITDLFKTEFGDKIRIQNDVALACIGGFAFKTGIGLVAGTGSMAVTFDKEDRLIRCGGWGPDCGDEGSAHWIGKKALEAYGKMSDSRIPKSKLYYLMKEELSIEDDFDIIDIVIKSEDKRKIISSMSTYVGQSAEEDEVSREILKQAADELALLILGIINKQNSQCEEIKVAYFGGVFNCGKYILEPLKQYLLEANINISLQEPVLRASLGGILLAKGKDNLDNDFIKNLKD